MLFFPPLQSLPANPYMTQQAELVGTHGGVELCFFNAIFFTHKECDFLRLKTCLLVQRKEIIPPRERLTNPASTSTTLSRRLLVKVETVHRTLERLMRRCLSRIGSIRLEKLVNGFSRVSLQHSLHSSHDRKFHSIARGVAGGGDSTNR